jgi:hypothetical protein
VPRPAQTNAPAQPVGAGAKAVAPAADFVECPDEVEEARRGRVEVDCELRDLISEPIDLCDVHEPSP